MTRSTQAKLRDIHETKKEKQEKQYRQTCRTRGKKTKQTKNIQRSTTQTTKKKLETSVSSSQNTHPPCTLHLSYSISLVTSLVTPPISLPLYATAWALHPNQNMKIKLDISHTGMNKLKHSIALFPTKIRANFESFHHHHHHHTHTHVWHHSNHSRHHTPVTHQSHFKRVSPKSQIFPSFHTSVRNSPSCSIPSSRNIATYIYIYIFFKKNKSPPPPQA